LFQEEGGAGRVHQQIEQKPCNRETFKGKFRGKTHQGCRKWLSSIIFSLKTEESLQNLSEKDRQQLGGMPLKNGCPSFVLVMEKYLIIII